MPTLVIKKPDGTEEQRQWAGQLTIGGGSGNDLVLSAAGISERHAKLSEAPGGTVEIEDAGSEAGTFVDGRRIVARTALKPSSAVNLGKVQLLLKPDGDGPSAA